MTNLTGDRFCIKCGYNLLGQAIVREEHYGLLIVRCPECATVTALQEYPLLGAWGARWGVALAAIWMVFLLAAWPASSGVLLGFGVSMVEEGTRDYGRYLDRLQEADPAATTPGTPAPPAPGAPTRRPPGTVTIQGTTIIMPSFGSNPQFAAWWSAQDQGAVLAAAGGWAGAYDHVELLMLIPAGVTAFVIGCFWSVFLIQVPRRWLFACALAIIGLACLLAMIALQDLGTRSMFSGRRAAEYQLAVPTMAVWFGVATVALLAGLHGGRSLARLAACALLPPKLRGPFSLLWATRAVAKTNSPAGEPAGLSIS